MRAVFDPLQLRHVPLTRLAGGELRPTPETAERATLLLAALEETGIPVEAPGNVDDSAIFRVHTPDYLAFLRDGFAEWSVSPGNGPEMRASVHPVRGAARQPKDLLGRAGYFQGDASCVLVEGTWEAAQASARSAVMATELVLDGQAFAYGLCRPPGHHAARDLAGGFCYLNNAAIAAEHAVTRGLRVAILDLDVHHGNGTQQIFYARDDVLTISLHGDPDWLYPFYAGFADETGSGAGEGANLNLPIALHSGYGAYAEAMAIACTRIRAFAPDMMILALGLDAARSDPFACMALESDDFARLGAQSSLGIPTAVIQEGGYPSAELGGNLVWFLKGLLE